jgi:serine/threonine protein phosphatase PrpC
MNFKNLFLLLSTPIFMAALPYFAAGLPEPTDGPLLPYKLDIGAMTHGKLSAGKARSEKNEDRYSIQSDNHAACVGVFDGHISPGAPWPGALVSDLAAWRLAPLCQSVRYAVKRGSDCKPLVHEWFIGVDNEVSNFASVGSTAVTAFFLPDKLIVAHAGDSRLVVSNRWSASALQTIDHNGNSKKERDRVAAAGGRFVGSRLWVHADGDMGMSRSLGDRFPYQDEKGKIVLRKPPGLSAEPDIFDMRVDESINAVILASDGFWDFVSVEEAMTLAQLCRSLGSNAQRTALELYWKARFNESLTTAFYDERKLSLRERTQQVQFDDITVVVVFLDWPKVPFFPMERKDASGTALVLDYANLALSLLDTKSAEQRAMSEQIRNKIIGNMGTPESRCLALSNLIYLRSLPYTDSNPSFAATLTVIALELLRIQNKTGGVYGCTNSLFPGLWETPLIAAMRLAQQDLFISLLLAGVKPDEPAVSPEELVSGQKIQSRTYPLIEALRHPDPNLAAAYAKSLLGLQTIEVQNASLRVIGRDPAIIYRRQNALGILQSKIGYKIQGKVSKGAPNTGDDALFEVWKRIMAMTKAPEIIDDVFMHEPKSEHGESKSP